MKKTPRLSDFKGLYNVSPESHGVDPTSPDAKDFLCLEKGLGLPSFREVDHIAKWFSALDRRLKRAKTVKKVRPSDGNALHYNVEFNDRTASLTFCDTLSLDQPLLEEIRIFLQTEAPLWRVVVQGIDDDTSIVVYPTTIVFPGTGDPEKQLRVIRDKTSRYHDKTTGAFNRQLQYAKKTLESWAPLPRPPYEPRVVCAFDSDWGESDCVCIWILEDGYGHQDRSWIPKEETAEGFEGISGKTELDVDVDGHVLDFMSAGEKFAGVLTGLVYCKRLFRGSIELVEPLTGSKRPYQIPAESILSDAEVRRRLGSGTE